MNEIISWLSHLAQKHSELWDLGTSILLAILGPLALWIAFNYLGRIAARRLIKRPWFSQNPSSFAAIRQALRYGLVLASGLYLIEILKIQPIRHLFAAGMVLFFASPVNKLVRLLLHGAQGRLGEETGNRTALELLHRFAGVLVFGTAVVIALDLVGINVMPFIAGASVLGAAVGFAAKDTLSNVIAGVVLLMDRPFQTGDRIEIWNAPKNYSSWGDVVRIGLRATKIRTTDHLIVVIPNNQIMSRDIVNYSAESSPTRVRISVGVAYDTDMERAKKGILEAAAGADWICREPEPKVVLTDFGDCSITLQARVWIKDPRRRRETTSYLTDSIKKIFDREGIEIPFPIRTLVTPQEKKGRG
ncbi:MAG: mechanosensitive ion channel family protein [Thermodesulfobacteriota bacterium]